MLMIKDLNLDQKLSVGVALVFSSEVLPLFEAKHPNDLEPRKAIESAIRCLQNPSKETRAAADSAAAAASVTYDAYAASAARYAADYAAYAARYAAYAASYSASAAARYAAYSANAASTAAFTAASAAHAGDKERYIHDGIKKLLPLIVEYKIENKQSFNNAEKVLENLSDEDKMSFLFNLDILR